MPQPVPRIPSSLIPFLAEVSDGDARQALNSLELALSVCKRREADDARNGDNINRDGRSSGIPGANADAQDLSGETDADRSLMEAIKKGLRKGYDRTGEERYDMISAMHKSIRGSDGSAALYWLARYDLWARCRVKSKRSLFWPLECWKVEKIHYMWRADWSWSQVKMLDSLISKGSHWYGISTRFPFLPF